MNEMRFYEDGAVVGFNTDIAELAHSREFAGLAEFFGRVVCGVAEDDAPKGSLSAEHVRLDQPLRDPDIRKEFGKLCVGLVDHHNGVLFIDNSDGPPPADRQVPSGPLLAHAPMIIAPAALVTR